MHFPPAFILVITLIPMGSIYCTAHAEDDGARLYTTREEKREAGIKHRIFPWFVASGLAEFEWQWQRFGLDHPDHSDVSDNASANIQGGFFITPIDWIKSEIITEYDTDTNEFIVDEAEIAVDYGPWEIAGGKMYLPFGVYFSHFATGPIVEVGETQATSASIAYNHLDKLDISVAVYRGKAHKSGSSGRLDWSAGIEAWPSHQLGLGISFISDLADSNQRLLEEHQHRYTNKVPALSGYLLWAAENYEISLELLGALETFDELDSDRDQPFAANLEFTHYVTPKIDWSVRIEGSSELEDAPELQAGLAFNYKILKNVFITVEGLHGYFRDSLAANEAGDDYESVTTFGALLSVGF
ncbi:MAG: LbtU family siderophore porin [Gammaproteobacteria bacterium]